MRTNNPTRSLALALCAVALLVATAASPAYAEEPKPSPMATLKTRTAEFKELLKSPKGEERSNKVKGLVDSLVDYEELARRSLGGKEWGKRTADEKKEFTALLQKLIEKGYVEQSEKDPEFKVKWLEEELGKKGDVARVATLASTSKQEVELEYRLMLTERGWIAYNLLVDGVSMTRNYKKTFKRIIKKDGFKTLLQRMQRKLDGAEDEELDPKKSSEK